MKLSRHRQTALRRCHGLCLVWLIVVLSSGMGCATNRSSHDQHRDHAVASRAATPEPTPRIPAFFADLAQAQPLPAVLDPKQFSDPVIAKVYRYAQQAPEVFAQQPCYCNCDDGFGHRSLLDCYATDHSAG